MPSMKALLVATLFQSVISWSLPGQEKFKPLVAACDGLDTLTNCSSSFKGTCATHKKGRFCLPGCGHEEHGLGSLKGLLHGLAHKFSDHAHNHHEHHWTHVIGDCGDKEEGDECSFERAGRCIPTGKCPVFKGATVCKPWDSHPPAFVTGPCNDKKEGDKCGFAGICTKVKYEDALVCKWSLPNIFGGGGSADSQDQTSAGDAHIPENVMV